VIFGPLSESQLSQVIAKLDQFKAHYTLDGENIEVADSLVPLVEEELVRIGALPPIEEPELDHEEYLCPQCDFISHVPGTCPKHGVALVDFSSWVKGEGKSSNDKVVAFVFVAVLVVAIYFMFLKR
jgi:hypothetical protein